MNHLPLLNLEDDKLSFQETSKSIAEFINDFPNTIPYSIAIYGNWGSGKSTMLNFIEKDLDENNVVLRFNPWEILNEENLVPTLFEEIAFAIGQEKYKKLKQTLLDYGRKICTTGAKIASRTLLESQGFDEDSSTAIADLNSGIVDSIFDSNSPKPLSKRKKELEMELQKWAKEENKKLTIIIDEVDRLFPSEIVEIFKIIKATISFPGVIFIVAMDKNSVMDSLRSINITRPDEYLIKLFQQRYYIDSEFQLQTLFKEILNPRIPKLNGNAKKSLQKAINAIIFFDKEDRYYLREDQNYIKDLDFAYNQIYHQLRAFLSIPRSFINYSHFLLSNWEKYYNSIFDDEFNDERDNIILFLFITIAYIDPYMIKFNILGNRHINDKTLENLPNLILTVRVSLLNKIFKSEGTKTESNTYYEKYNDEIIKKIILKIKQYPDHNS